MATSTRKFNFLINNKSISDTSILPLTVTLTPSDSGNNIITFTFNGSVIDVDGLVNDETYTISIDDYTIEGGNTIVNSTTNIATCEKNIKKIADVNNQQTSTVDKNNPSSSDTSEKKESKLISGNNAIHIGPNNVLDKVKTGCGNFWYPIIKKVIPRVYHKYLKPYNYQKEEDVKDNPEVINRTGSNV